MPQEFIIKNKIRKCHENSFVVMNLDFFFFHIVDSKNHGLNMLLFLAWFLEG